MVNTVSIPDGKVVLCQCSSKSCQWREKHGKVSAVNSRPDSNELDINGAEKPFWFVCSDCSTKTKIFGKAKNRNHETVVDWRTEIPKTTKESFIASKINFRKTVLNWKGGNYFSVKTRS